MLLTSANVAAQGLSIWPFRVALAFAALAKIDGATGIHAPLAETHAFSHAGSAGAFSVSTVLARAFAEGTPLKAGLFLLRETFATSFWP